MKKKVNFQTIIKRLNEFWSKQGVLIGQPYGMEVGAGTANPNTFFRVLGPEPFSMAYVEPSRRPADGRYGENPNRLQHYFQYQIILKPAPYNHIQIYLDMLEYLGINLKKHDIRFVEDNWASPSLRAWGVGWEVWLDSMEVTQYTYFQQMGGIDIDLPTVEITLGLERLAMYINDIDDYRNIPWDNNVSYGDIFQQHEYYQSQYNYELADVDMLKQLLWLYEEEASRLIDKGNFWAAYDYILRMSHMFNILDARGAASDLYRRELFKKMGEYLSRIAKSYVESRKRSNFPLLKQVKEKDKSDQRKNFRTNNKTEYIPNVSDVPLDILKISSDLKKCAKETFSKVLGEDFDIDKALLLEFEVEDLPEPVLPIIKNRCTRDTLQKIFEEFGLSYSRFYPIVTPNKVGFILSNFAISRKEKVIVGPPQHIAIKNGKPTQVMNKLLEKYSDLLIRYEIQNGKVVFYLKNKLDRKQFLDSVYKTLFTNIPYMHMRINGKNVIRPLLSYIFIENGHLYQVPDFEMLPKALHPNVFILPKWLGANFVKLESAKDWLYLIQKLGIILHPDYRLKYIRGAIEKFVASNNSRSSKLSFSSSSEAKSLFEVVNMLNSSPYVYYQKVPEKYNVLPESVIDYVLWSNQKYIVLKQSNKDSQITGYLASIVADNPLVQAERNIKQGALKVISARLDDALFYFNKDKDVAFDGLLAAAKHKQLGPILGTLADKRQRMQILASAVYEKINFHEANGPKRPRQWSIQDIRVLIDVFKLDLVTNLGKEFPALEGKIMAAYLSNPDFLLYHKNNINGNKNIIDALNNYGDIEKSNLYGLLALLLDKLDDLVKLTLAKGFPKGSTDPYGLKARADVILQVLIKLLKDYDISFNFNSFVKEVIISYYINHIGQFKKMKNSDKYIKELLIFMNNRLVAFVNNHPDDYNLAGYELNTLRSVLLSGYGFIAEKVVKSDSLLEFLNNEEFRDKIKRIYNFVKNKHNFKDQVYNFSFNGDFKILQTKLQALSLESKIIGTGAQNILDLALALVNMLQERNKFYVVITRNNFLSDVTDKLKNILLFTSDFIDNNRINIPENLEVTHMRLEFLYKIAQVIQIFVNIPVLLNQD